MVGGSCFISTILSLRRSTLEAHWHILSNKTPHSRVLHYMGCGATIVPKCSILHVDISWYTVSR
jgi:hypothetical protein